MAVVSQPNDPFSNVFTTEGDVQIRTAKESDAEFVSRCEVFAFEEKFAHVVGRNKFERLIKGLVVNFPYRRISYHRIFIAEYQGRPAGVMEIAFPNDYKDSEGGDSSAFSSLGCCPVIRLGCMESCLSETPDASHCYLAVLCVADGFRGKGIGKALMDRADWEAKSKGCKAIYLHVLTTNRAKNLYGRQGYRCTEQKDGGCCLSCIIGVSRFDKMVKPLP